jgi:hypothetical protein
MKYRQFGEAICVESCYLKSFFRNLLQHGLAEKLGLQAVLTLHLTSLVAEIYKPQLFSSNCHTQEILYSLLFINSPQILHVIYVFILHFIDITVFAKDENLLSC